MDMKPVKISGEIFYAHDMVQFNQYTESQQKYVAQIGNLSEQAAQKLRELGIYVGQHDVKGLNVSCKSKHVHKPVDENGKDIDPKIIGNGSKCIALIKPYEWSFGKKTGVGASLVRLIVTDLKEYVPSTNKQEEDDDIL